MAKKGHIPWNKGKKGVQIRSSEVRKRISESMKGKSTAWLTGRKLTDEHKKRISVSSTGKKRPWVKGHPKGWQHSPETRKKLSGANNKFWKGGITPINLVIRNSAEYKLWRIAVFARDSYTCVWCGIKGGTLNADHIKPFALYPELRFAIDNGRTLCVPCHKTTDTFARNIKNMKDNTGFNSKTGEIEDLVDAQITDPANIVLNAVRNAISVATSVLTSPTIVTLPREEQTNYPHPALMR